MKRFVSLILSILMLTPVFMGCAGDTPDAETSAITEAVETEPSVPPIDVVKDGACLYTLVRPETHTALLYEGCKNIVAAFKNSLGVEIKSVDDWVQGKVNAGEYESAEAEILIGETNRRESLEVYMTLSAGEYAIRAVGNKIVILGFNDNCTLLAVERFISDYVSNAKNGTLEVPGDLSVLSSITPKKDDAQMVQIEKITPVGEQIKLDTEVWVACEIEFTSDKTYDDPVYTVDMDAVFYNEKTGTVLTVPAFWDGGKSWKVRFAPTEVGEWSFYTVCTDTANSGLHHRGGKVTCKEYSGDLDIYKHGFIKTERGKNYFMYADGTPFFYLADTHWTLALEEIDSYGSVETQKFAGITKELADQYGVTSQFKYIMDHRAEQGYTVIESQPLGWWTNPGQNGWFADEYQNIFTYGVNDIMLAKFQQYDVYFDYIAELGMVHSNTQFGYPTALMTEYFAGKITDAELEKLCRYWVARYSAYPVMWATTQEGDNDYYGVDRGDCAATPETNPWFYVMDWVAKYDPYDHPSTCHQENAIYTRVKNSRFDDSDNHTWYAAQYNYAFNGINWEWAKEYYGNAGSKPVVNYEGPYDHWDESGGSSYGVRVQAWGAYMNGQFGYGYGVQPIWSIFWAQNGYPDYESRTVTDAYGETFDKGLNWIEGLYLESGEQVTYIKDYLQKYEWWRLVPCFNKSYFYQPGSCKYSVSHIGNEIYIGYFYGKTHNDKLGKLTAMANGEYEVQWFNCITGEYGEAFTVTVTDGVYQIPAKPDVGDWVISVKKIK